LQIRIPVISDPIVCRNGIGQRIFSAISIDDNAVKWIAPALAGRSVPVPALVDVDANHSAAELGAATNGVKNMLAAGGADADEHDGDVGLVDFTIDELIETGRTRGRALGELGTPKTTLCHRWFTGPPIPDDARAPQIFGKVKAEKDPLCHARLLARMLRVASLAAAKEINKR
jgi:hypothetical protein